LSFDTITFWLFFPIAWAAWRFLPFGAAKTAALLLSLLFYAWWNPWYLSLILLSAVVDFRVGLRIHGTQDQRARLAVTPRVVIMVRNRASRVPVRRWKTSSLRRRSPA
jgi:hypothetical protein